MSTAQCYCIIGSPAAQSMAAGVVQVVQLRVQANPDLCEVPPAAGGGMNENRIHGENRHFALLQMLMCPHPWLFPVVHMEDFIPQQCSCIMLKARSPSLEKNKQKCP